MSMQNALDAFFDREEQDAFARRMGWEDAAQMCYYEDMAEKEWQLHELWKVDAREVYEEPVDWSGVY